MPKVRNPSIRPHLHPLVLRAEFSHERLYSGPLSTMRRVFDPEPNGTVIKVVNPPEPVCHEVVAPSMTAELIPKPNGEVTRLNRNGYNLLRALAWEPDFYSEVQVCISMTTMNYELY
jgi:hypothetical protein